MQPLLEDFGQKVDLTRGIREVLVNYPEGTTVLKELIQNADDAGARKVCLCLDKRLHGTESLLSNGLKEWQGAALLAYNDAVFSDEDFISISRIGGSKKVGQTWKTGRFGVGFNSIYHLTDLPSFVSDKYVVIFDPQGAYLPDISVANPGKRIDYVSSSAILFYEDQFVPYRAFGCDMIKPYHGTLFRFPLRNADQAVVSKLSRQVYTEESIISMFTQLYKEAVFSLLFLKNVISLELCIWEDGAYEPRRIYSCSITSPNESTTWHRHAIMRSSTAVVSSSNLQLDSFSLDFLSEDTSGTKLEMREDTFFIVQGMAVGRKISDFATMAAKEYDLPLLPWASVAAHISDASSMDTLKQGLAFCFLPLPVKTGLTVQVNAYFEISSNRRSIWFGADMDRGGKLRSDWNKLLLEDAVAPAFSELLLSVSKQLGSTKIYYALWPCGSFQQPWDMLVAHFYQIIYSKPVLYSDSGGGKWISPDESFIHDVAYSDSTALSEALVLLDMPIVHLPENLVVMFSRYYPNFLQMSVSPETVRRFLKDCRNLYALSNSYRFTLLDYCLSDLSDNDVAKHGKGIPLLPLANGQFAHISEASQGACYFICDELEYALLSRVSERVINRSIPLALFNRLSKIAHASKANLTFLDAKKFLQLFYLFFPTEWKLQNRVLWDPELCSTHPSSTWFVLFWQYINDRSYDLSIFNEWPLFPSTSKHLYRASKSSKMINAEKLSDAMKNVLSKIGCKILNPNCSVSHPDLSLYVYDGDAAGVLNSIFESVSDNQLHTVFQNCSADDKTVLFQFLLQPKWYYGNHLSDLHIMNCKKLPIFRVYYDGDSQNFYFSDLINPKKNLPPVDIPEYFLGGEFVMCSLHSEEDILTRFYGIDRMQKTYFYKNHIFNRLNELEPGSRDSIMLSILNELPQLCVSDSSFKEFLRSLEFVPNKNGSLKSPSSLYDPRIEEVYALLEDSDSFPCTLFHEPGILDMLLVLGLKTSVSTDTIIQSARQVESLMHNDQVKANMRGKVLLSYLEVNATKWLPNSPFDSKKKITSLLSKVTIVKFRDEVNLENFWADLRMICWCPVLTSAPHPALPWPSVLSKVAPPKLVRLKSDMWLVSASTRILDGECSSSKLSLCLGWSSPISGSVIAAQLLELGKNNEIVTDQMLRQELAIAMPKMYSLLTDMIGSDEMDIVKAVLEGSRWIWVGDGFATVTEVVLNGHLHLAPYIRVIPVDLAVFKELFLELGVKEYLKPIDYANILSRMASRKGDSPLNGLELRTSIIAAQHLAEAQFQDFNTEIFLPDISSRLCPVTDLVYNDAPWLLDVEDDPSTASLNSKRNVYNLVHGNISNDVAEKLGACSLRRLLLAENSDCMKLSLSAEAFGQHEALTTRLKHIVEMYADGPGILFELVQNAEDAKASEVIFLLDKSQYGTKSILSPGMTEWQGPALYCFNNSVFSQHDLNAVSRIGQDSKLERPFAIGRFGLGFNCVYHFTDIPGFVSGDNIVMFDPHACYLPGISPTHPGMKIKFIGRRILDQFPDQFSPFLHFGCDLQQSFPGTLFRFPLRNETTASRSQIKNAKYAPEDVQMLFTSFSEVVSESLLFLRNVQKISMFVKDGNQHDMTLIHSASKRSVIGIGKELHPLHSMLDFISGSQKKGMDKPQFLNMLGKTADQDLPWHSQKIEIEEQNPFKSILHHWILSECIGGGNAKHMSLSLNKSHKFIPWASVAAHINSVYNEDPIHIINKFEGRAFCFLPLPVVTGFAVHINAYFELSSNRRDIWFGNDMAGGGKVRSEWNVCLLEDAVSRAYARILVCIAEETGSPTETFFSFWPTATKTEPWASMVRKLYLSISDLGLPVLYTKARGGQWISTRQAIFPDYTFPKVAELMEALSDAGLPIVTVPKPIVERFTDSCPSLHFLNPFLLRNLLIRRKRGFKDKDAMLITLSYCLSDMSGSNFSENLFGLPLVPLANGSFTMFSKPGQGEKIYVTSLIENNLLKDSVPHLIVDCLIPTDIFEKFQSIAQSGSTNICELTSHSLVELFPRILPEQWQHAKQVFWDPSQHGVPSIEWMKMLWDYLNLSCADLNIFSKWPLLPVGNDHLFQLTENSNVIINDGWSENMSSLLQKIGCAFLKSDFQINHPQIKNFVQDATASGILNAIQAVNSNSHGIKNTFSNASRGEMHELRSFILQSRWFVSNQIDANHIEIINNLPIFESYTGRDLVSLANPTKLLVPEGMYEDLLDGNFVRAASDVENSILKCYLGIKEVSRSEFYRDHVLNQMSRFISDSSKLFTIFRDIKGLMEHDADMKTSISETPFVLAANGSWKHPSRLYDPRITSLRNFLHKEVFFPDEKFSDDGILDLLTSMGLKQSLSHTGLLDSARSVSMLHDSGNMEAQIYSKRLFMYLNVLGAKLSDGNIESSDEHSWHEIHNDNESGNDLRSLISNFVPDLSENEFWSEIKTISWCPVYSSPPLQGIPWLDSHSIVAPPSMTRPKFDMWMVSAKMRILDNDCCSSFIQHGLGWLEPLDAEVLSIQLVELSKSYGTLKLQYEQENCLDEILAKQIPLIYSKLQEFIDTENFKILIEILDGVPWVYIGDNFILPEALAFDSPVTYHPYLYAVPSELQNFKDLLQKFGVKSSFAAMDYLNILQRVQHDFNGKALLSEQLNLVQHVLEAFLDCYDGKELDDASINLLLIPDSSGMLMHPYELVYNDAPWLEKTGSNTVNFVHPCITNDLARKLGAKSLRSSSLVDEEMTRDLPCMDYSRIIELRALYGEDDYVLFDLLELADCCNAKKLHVIYDKREHPKQSLLQHNLGEFQGPSLTVVIEGAAFSRGDVCDLQLPPPWKIQGNQLNYGLGLISCYFMCDIMTIASAGYYYIFDPLGLVLNAKSSSGAAAKLFFLEGTGLRERFKDQFSPMTFNQGISISTSGSTVMRMPLSSKFLNDDKGSKSVRLIFDRYKQHASSSLLFLKSVLQVSLSTWEDGHLQPSLDYSVSIDPSSSILRNPFSEKKWRKFQLSRLFSSSNAAVKMNVMDVHVMHGCESVMAKWLVVLCLGSGKTRDMALDRRYLAYNLTPVAGIALCISQNGQPIDGPTTSGCVLSPLPLTGSINMPVTALGYFLVHHKGGRYLFNHPSESTSSELRFNPNSPLLEAWNKELLICVRDAYVEMVLEFQKLRKNPLSSCIEPNAARAMTHILHLYGDKIYCFWPRSRHGMSTNSNLSKTNAERELMIEQVIRPFYARLVDLPVWQLYNGNAVKCDEGMFLSQAGTGGGEKLPPSAVCNFIKEHYPVFSVPWELVGEIQAVGVKVREIKPKMVRDLLKSSKYVHLRSIEAYVVVLDYCFSDIQHQQSSDLVDINTTPSSDLNIQRSDYSVSQNSSSTSGGDALEMMTFFGKALYDFGRGVVEDIGRSGGPLSDVLNTSDGPLPSIVTELRGMPFPTAGNRIARLGINELWVGTKDQQQLMCQLSDNFIHPLCLEKTHLAEFLFDQTIHRFMKLMVITPQLLASNLRQLFTEQWVNHVYLNSNGSPWVTWDINSTSPTSEWIHLFWKVFKDLNGDLSYISDWPLFPAFLNGPVLCRVKASHLIFIPPITAGTNNESDPTNSDLSKLYMNAFESTKSRYPWLLNMLNQLNIPVYDMLFVDCGVSSLLPLPGQTLAKAILLKLVSSKKSGYFSTPDNLSSDDCERLFALFSQDFIPGSIYDREELDMLRELPIYRTVTGTYTKLLGSDQYMVPSMTFYQPLDNRCLSYSVESSQFLCALGIKELLDQEVLVKFALPGFEQRTSNEKEDILLYVFLNWKDLQIDSIVLDTLRRTNFLRNANELCLELFKPEDLLDPSDSLLMSVFVGERDKFPGERFVSDEWLCILRKVGLRTSSQADTIIECAKKVELLGKELTNINEYPDDIEADFSSTRNEVSFELWSLASSIVDTIFSNFATLYDHTFCQTIGKISFIPCEKGIPSIGGKKGGKRVLSSYVNSILLRDWPLAWSSAPIITKQNIVPPEYSWGAFHFKSPPAFSVVSKHLEVIGRNNGEDTLAHWPTEPGMMTIEDASLDIFRYLEKVWGTLSSSDITMLQKVAFIPVANGTRLVTAKALFVRLTGNLSPFAFELPSLFLPFVKILKELGIQEVLTIAYAREILSNIQKSCGYQRLNPNELRAVMEILTFICSGKTSVKTLKSDWIFDAIVPDDGCRLVHARSCIYIDSCGAQFLGNIETSRLRFSHPELAENICLTLGIKKLSDVVVEVLDEELQMQIVDKIRSTPVKTIRDKLSSKLFQDAVWILICSLTNHFPSSKSFSFHQLESSLNQIAKKLQFVQVLHTRFLMLPNYHDITNARKSSKIPEWENSIKHRTTHFVDKSRTQILIADPPSYLSIYDVISVLVSHILDAPTVLSISPLLECPPGSEKLILDALKLGSDSRVNRNESKNNNIVGSEILPQDALLVQFLPMRPFYSGEIVAWKSGRDGEKLKYGRVVENVRPTSGQALHRLRVEIGQGGIQALLSTHVFSFKSVSITEGTSSSSVEENMATDENSVMNVENSMNSEVVNERQYGKVSSRELVQAVHDMLSAAGIDMDAGKQTLLQTTLSLQEQVKDSQVALLVEQDRADAAIKEADAAKAAWSCRICLSAEVNTTIVPCGHVLCLRCSSAVTRCPFCRCQVSKTMKIFRP